MTDKRRARLRVDLEVPATLRAPIWRTAIATFPTWNAWLAQLSAAPQPSGRSGALSNDALMAMMRLSMEHPDGVSD